MNNCADEQKNAMAYVHRLQEIRNMGNAEEIVMENGVIYHSL